MTDEQYEGDGQPEPDFDYLLLPPGTQLSDVGRQELARWELYVSSEVGRVVLSGFARGIGFASAEEVLHQLWLNTPGPDSRVCDGATVESLESPGRPLLTSCVTIEIRDSDPPEKAWRIAGVLQSIIATIAEANAETVRPEGAVLN